MDADALQGSILLHTLDDIACVHVLTAAECATVAALDVPMFVEAEPAEVRGSSWRLLCFHLFGVLIVLALLVLTPIKLPSHLVSTALILRLSPTANPQVAEPNINQGVSVVSEIIVSEPVLLSEPRPADAEISAINPAPEPPPKLSSSISQSKAAVLQAWSDSSVGYRSAQQGDYRGQGTVFDSRLNTRLSHIAPGRLTAVAASSALADVNGMQEVIVGDKCFQVTKLDDQAMRGMGVWTRGHCQASNKNKEKISIGVLP